jgi:myo-inositol-1-phosphate synthase
MPKKAIDLFNQIATPDEFTITFLFNACAQLGTTDALNLTKKISKEMPESFYLDHFLLTSLLDVLVKCGDVTHAQTLFDNSKKKSLSMYGAMMKGLNYFYISN